MYCHRLISVIMDGSVSGLSLLSLCCISLSQHHYRSGFVHHFVVSLDGCEGKLPLGILLQVCLGSYLPFTCHVNFKISLSCLLKNPIGISVGIAMSLYFSFGRKLYFHYFVFFPSINVVYPCFYL